MLGNTSICGYPFSIWWRRGELNPRPKIAWQELLRVQVVICIPSSERERTPSRIW